MRVYRQNDLLPRSSPSWNRRPKIKLTAVMAGTVPQLQKNEQIKTGIPDNPIHPQPPLERHTFFILPHPGEAPQQSCSDKPAGCEISDCKSPASKCRQTEGCDTSPSSPAHNRQQIRPAARIRCSPAPAPPFSAPAY